MSFDPFFGSQKFSKNFFSIFFQKIDILGGFYEKFLKTEYVILKSKEKYTPHHFNDST